MMLKTILLADDDPRDVDLTLAALNEQGLVNRVVVVRDGAEALDFLHSRGAFVDRRDGNPGVIMLDIKMPRVDGIEVLRQIRETESLRLIPVVMLTSSREEHDLLRSYRLGVNAYVVKPVDFGDFVDAVRSLGLFWGLLNEQPAAAESASR